MTLFKADLLVVDDLGTELLSDWTIDEIFFLVFYRYSHCKPTVFTSNYDLSEIYAKYCKKYLALEAETVDIADHGNLPGAKNTPAKTCVKRSILM